MTAVVKPAAAKLERIEWMRGGLPRRIDVEPGATVGAQVGRDLYDQAGNLIQDLGVYVGEAIVAKDTRFLNGYPAEKIITPQGTLIVREIAAEAIRSGSISVALGITSGGSISISSGGRLLTMGIDFGVTGDLLMWFGPTPGPGGPVKANGLFWIDNTGSAYFGGSVDLEIAGSGAKLGDQRNNHPTTIGSIRSYWDGQTITYTVPTTGTTHSIDVTAATLRMGSVSIAYSASSAAITQARSTTQLWHLYYLDATYAGGARTLNATTDPNNLANADDVVWVGKVSVVVPAGGAGGGGGGTGGGGGGGGILQ